MYGNTRIMQMCVTNIMINTNICMKTSVISGQRGAPSPATSRRNVPGRALPRYAVLGIGKLCR